MRPVHLADAQYDAVLVHAGRAYKKLMPVIPLHRQQLDAFLKRFWIITTSC